MTKLLKVYTAFDSVQAHLVKILLQGEDIQCHVSGDYLQGAMGELPAVGMLEVLVDESDLQRAKSIIQEWEAADDPDDDSWIPSELR